jgi:CubicO group peptidase (beta-lactamase class C family)
MPGSGRWSPRLGVLAAAVLYAAVGCTVSPSSVHSPSPAVVSSSAVSSPGSSVREKRVDYEEMQQELERRLSHNDLSLQAVRGVLASVDGETVLRSYRRHRPGDSAHVFSVTKSVLSILVGIAIDDERLRLEQTVAELLPDHADQMTREFRSITLRQLLTMTAGMQSPGLEDLEQDPIGALVTGALVAEPGSTFLYSNASAHLVAAVLQRAVGLSVMTYAREKLFDPLQIDTRPAWEGRYGAVGFERAGFAWATDRDGLNLGGFGLKLAAGDMLKIGQLVLDGGRWQGRRVVSAEWVKQSTTNQLFSTQRTPTDGRYGYFWWVGETHSHPYFAASGSYGQLIGVVPDARLVVVTVCDDSGQDAPSEAFNKMLDEVIFEPILGT